MITFNHEEKKLYCDGMEWECYSGTPNHVIEEINALVYSVVTTNTDPVVAQKIIYDTIAAKGYGKYGFRDSEGDQCTTNIINKYYSSNIDRWANLSLKAEWKNQKWIHTTETPKKEENPTIPACNQCKHYEYFEYFGSQCNKHYTEHPDYIDGGYNKMYYTAIDARKDESLCGLEARDFEPKEKEQQPKPKSFWDRIGQLYQSLFLGFTKV
jgi:hypothetical protein